jgi:hypothetical protein
MDTLRFIKGKVLQSLVVEVQPAQKPAATVASGPPFNPEPMLHLRSGVMRRKDQGGGDQPGVVRFKTSGKQTVRSAQAPAMPP